MNPKIFYLAAIHERKDAGVVKKIESTASALADKGYATEVFFGHQDGYRGILQIRDKIRSIKADMIILRGCGYYTPLLVMALWAKRRQGVRIVIDIPTPMVNLLFEIWIQRKSIRGALLRISLALSSLPWSYWVAHRVIQYGQEHPWFLLGLRHKTVLMGNGIRVANIPRFLAKPDYNGQSLILIGVAKLFVWHGFDRVIRGIAEYEIERKNHLHSWPEVNFVVVGDGPERIILERLVIQLSIQHLVRFEGHQIEDVLYKNYSSAHIAVSSLGLHRQSLKFASPLKAREYLCMGLPIVFSYNDPDIPDNTEFTFRVPADDSPLKISALIDWYSILCKKNILPESPRRFAEKYLDYSAKIKVYEDLLKNLNHNILEFKN